MRTTIGLAACAAVAFACVTLFSPPHVAFAQVVERVNRTRTLTLTIDADDPGKSFRVLIKSPDLMRVERPGGAVMIWNKATGQSLSLDPDKKSATRMVFARQPFDFYDWFRDFKNGKEERIGEKEFDGKKLLGFKVRRPAPGFAGAAPKEVTITLWVDPATSLPVRAEGEDDGRPAGFTDLKFDVPLADELFAMMVPEGYTVHDLGGISSDQLKAPPTAEEAAELVLRPGVGIGAIRFGDSKERVVESLGPPEQTTSRGFELRYPSKGLLILVHPRSGVVAIQAISKQAAGPFVNNGFAGKTDKGIAMGATRAQVEAAYGKPDNADSTAKLEYKKLGATFIFGDDSLGQVFLANPRQGDQQQ